MMGVEIFQDLNFDELSMTKSEAYQVYVTEKYARLSETSMVVFAEKFSFQRCHFQRVVHGVLQDKERLLQRC